MASNPRRGGCPPNENVFSFWVLDRAPMGYNIADLFERAVDAVPDRVAVVCDGRRLTYREFDEEANRLAHHLLAQGFGHGDHIGIYGQNSAEWLIAMVAAFKVRAERAGVKRLRLGYSDEISVFLNGQILFSGDLVEFDATPYAGDAYFQDWPQTLDNIAALQPVALVPGRGAALTTPEMVAAGLAGTRGFIADVWASVKAGVAAGKDLNAVYKETMAKLSPKYGHWVIFNHCMPFDVTRCYDEATQYPHPRIWTAERDIEMWKTLEGA